MREGVGPLPVAPSPKAHAYDVMVPSESVEARASNWAVRPLEEEVKRAIGGLLTGAAVAANQPVSEAPYTHGDEAKLPNGVIGLTLHVGAERIGDPAVLYVGMVPSRGTGSTSRASTWR